jgi:glyoxylase-like metal-dependent hydrolase (beta-lactamase superfamily II)
MRRSVIGVPVVVACLAALVALRPAPQRAAAFTLTRITDDIYFAVGSGAMSVGSNAAVIINESDVLLVDSHVSPAAAQALLDELKAITPKPVKYVVNTHFHFDHAHGNQIYGPGVEIIGHTFTREMMAKGASLRGAGYDRFVGAIPATIARLKAQRDSARTDSARNAIDRNIAAQELYKRQTDEVRATPPTVAFDQSMTLVRGGREIRFHFLGRGHTGGDIFVHLPREKVLVTGDILQSGVPFMADGWFADWPETLEKVKALDFDVFLPGHGQPVRDKARITYLQEYMRDFWAQAGDQYRRGATVEEAAQRIDLRKHATNFPAIRAVGADILAVRRAYELLGGRGN